MGKVIELSSRIKAISVEPVQRSGADVVSYQEQKQKMLFRDRRQIKRTILSEFVSSMVVLPEKGLMKVAIYDISEQGISFDLELDQGSFKLDEEICMRVYLNHKTYFPIAVQVKHVTTEQTEGVVRHGTVFLRHSENDAALQYFIKFIETVTLGLKKDNGDLMAPKTS